MFFGEFRVKGRRIHQYTFEDYFFSYSITLTGVNGHSVIREYVDETHVISEQKRTRTKLNFFAHKCGSNEKFKVFDELTRFTFTCLQFSIFFFLKFYKCSPKTRFNFLLWNGNCECYCTLYFRDDNF